MKNLLEYSEIFYEIFNFNSLFEKLVLKPAHNYGKH
jgi:hypothetical protein